MPPGGVFNRKKGKTMEQRRRARARERKRETLVQHGGVTKKVVVPRSDPVSRREGTRVSAKKARLLSKKGAGPSFAAEALKQKIKSRTIKKEKAKKASQTVGDVQMMY